MAVGTRDKWLLRHWTIGCWHILQLGVLLERAKWLLEHGTNGCWDIWQSGKYLEEAEWLLGHGPNGCRGIWQLGHLAVRSFGSYFLALNIELT